MSNDSTFPPVPPELKALAPYFQRAQELKVKDRVMAYWCTYFAAKQGIQSKAQSKEARPFLFQVMTILEEMKFELGDNENVSDDDAGAAYIENFALRVFNMADNEDRKEQATRSTAKKFLASANFFELLRIFDKPIDADIEEKIRYAKWKAADLAKAFREGRKPIPGDADAPPPQPPPPPPPPPPEVASPPAPAETLSPPHEFAPSMSAWSPGTSLAPSPAAHGMASLEPSPVTGTDVPLPHTASEASVSSPEPPPAPVTPVSSPRAFGVQLNLDRDGFTTPGMWSTMATPGTEDVYRVGLVNGGISESPTARRGGLKLEDDGDTDLDAGADVEVDAQDDAWSTMENQSMSRQGSWTVVDSAPTEGTIPPPSGLGLGLQPDGVPPPAPVKKVHFSPSVVGGLSSTSSSVAGSSPPASPERYAPSLPTVAETAYSSDSEAPALASRVDPAAHPLPESGSSASEAEGELHGAPPVIMKVPSPTGLLSPNNPPRQFPSAPPQFPLAPPQFPSAPPQFPAAPPQLPSAPPQFPTSPDPHNMGLSPQPPAPPALHPTPRFFSAPLGPPHVNNTAPPPPPSPPPIELTSTQISRIQKHCRFAISALDYEDADTARGELRAALAMLGM